MARTQNDLLEKIVFIAISFFFSDSEWYCLFNLCPHVHCWYIEIQSFFIFILYPASLLNSLISHRHFYKYIPQDFLPRQPYHLQILFYLFLSNRYVFISFCHLLCYMRFSVVFD